MSPWLFINYVYGYNNERKENRDGRLGVRFMEEGKVWILPFLLYADNLVMCSESEEI